MLFLFKVKHKNIENGTGYIQKFSKQYSQKTKNIESIQDNNKRHLIIRYNDNSIEVYDYILDKFYNHNKIQIHFGLLITPIIKQIESFNQNNHIVGNKVRQLVIQKIKNFIFISDKSISMLGIGGEYYLYFSTLIYLCSKNINKLIGVYSDKDLYEDSKNNIPNLKNYLIEYEKPKKFPKIFEVDIIIVNLFNLVENIIKYISQIKFKKIFIIACNLNDKKLKLLTSLFKIDKIHYIIDNISKCFMIKVIEISSIKV